MSQFHQQLRSAAIALLCVLALSAAPVYGGDNVAKWEYKVEQFQAPVSAQHIAHLEQSFNKLGASGWEMVSQDRDGLKITVTFKRKKS